jgi:hypothetical protein
VTHHDTIQPAKGVVIMSDAPGGTPVVPTPAALPRPTSSLTIKPEDFGRIAEDGTVYLQTPDGEVVVGQWAAGTHAEGLVFFGRKYEDLLTEVSLAEQRLTEGHATPDQTSQIHRKLLQGLSEPNFLGDITHLRDRLAAMAERIEDLRKQRSAERAEQRAAAAARREELAVEAEKLTTSTSWKSTSERFTAIVEEWKTLPRSDRKREQELWQRLSAARGAFDKRRRAHFTERDAQRKEALTAKRALIARAEQLSASTNWGETTRAFRDLTTEWKRAPRGSRQDEDKLWRRFKAAQDTFFEARKAADAAADAALRDNVAPKEALVVEAEALLPITDIPPSKKRLRDIQRRWEAIGDLPRDTRASLEGRLAKVEDAVRKAEQESWKKTNPEVRARAESAVTAFDTALEKHRKKLDAAITAGDVKKQEEIQGAIDQTEALRQAAVNAASDSSGRS